MGPIFSIIYFLSNFQDFRNTFQLKLNVLKLSGIKIEFVTYNVIHVKKFTHKRVKTLQKKSVSFYSYSVVSVLRMLTEDRYY